MAYLYVNSSYLHFYKPLLCATDLFSASLAAVFAASVMNMIAASVMNIFLWLRQFLSSQSVGLSIVTWKSGFLWFPWECEVVINWNFLPFSRENFPVHFYLLFPAVLFIRNSAYPLCCFFVLFTLLWMETVPSSRAIRPQIVQVYVLWSPSPFI